ncbi:MAG: hypothetical protein M1838_002481 [Thelocarpon superellum]|nr:MAG: hypothetical protein M1838_002481 [Thelocarpon superellum]
MHGLSVSSEHATNQPKTATGLQMLSQVGVVEWLDQDDRPIFVIDVSDAANFLPGDLQIIFENAALKALDGLSDRVAGRVDHSALGLAVLRDFTEFKAWATSFVQDHEALDVSLPDIHYEGCIWSSKPLAKRFRVIIGVYTPNVAGARAASSPAAMPILAADTFDPARASTRIGVAEDPHRFSPATSEATDYFGPLPADSVSRVSSPRATRPPTATARPDGPTSPAETSAWRPSQGQWHQVDAPTPSSEASHQGSTSTVGSRPTASSWGAESSHGCFDWTRVPNTPSLPRHLRLLRSVDWAATSLGPMEQWSPTLRAMCNMVMANPHATAMFWGPDLVVIYNEAYVPIAGSKHPSMLGQNYRHAWAELWPDLEPIFEGMKRSGKPSSKDDDCLFLKRLGYYEETYFSWSLVPVVGEDGTWAGCLNPAFEKTRRRIAERRMHTLREVGERVAMAREVKSFWAQVLKGLEYNAFDIPFVLLYSVSEESDSDVSSMPSNSVVGVQYATLEGSLGVPDGHAAAPARIDLGSCTEGFARHFREAAKHEKPMLLRTDDGTLTGPLVEGLARRGYADPCRAAVICPIHPTTGEAALGFFVMGVNPRRPYDDDYELFVQLLSRQLATSLASAVLFEEEIRRGQRAAQLAAKDRIELSQQLAARTQEAVESDTKFIRMAQLAPVGIFMADRQGQVTFFNDAWYKISRQSRDEDAAEHWMESVMDEDRETVMAMWHAVVVDRQQTTAEFRFKAPAEDRHSAPGDTWVLASVYPETSADGSLKSVFGSLTDIRQQKWAEDFQKRRTEEAVELKRQQENFIDITSHEMRNPLSAILQCADEISTSLAVHRGSEEQAIVDVPADVIESNIDAAQTIALCAQHQKRIVDDVLTLSKLDSALLIVTPVDVQPVAVAQRALKMFESEMQSNDIELRFEVLDSYRTLGINWVRLDPSRLLQVLINLTTNAIKFTHTQRKRTIIVSLGASVSRPSDHASHGPSSSSLAYFPTRSERTDPTTGADWGPGEGVYLTFAVQDTGRGLDDAEKKLLFLRFSQVSPRTHVQYGGSGLGLFISRELTELLGGEIGVSSESGKGSTFAFYVKARRSPTAGTEPDGLTVPSTPARKSSAARSPTIDAGFAGHARASGPLASPTRTTRAPVSYDVLIVEDNLVNQRVLERQLRNLGCTVRLANHGGEALAVLRQSGFWRGQANDAPCFIVLMDLEMPVMDGLTCAREIRRLQQTGEIVRHVPIVAVTANARIEQISNAMGAGTDDVMSKPFRIPELIPKLEELSHKYLGGDPSGSSSATATPTG